MMRYTKDSMLQDLRILGINSFQWPGEGNLLRKEVRYRMGGNIALGEDRGRAEVLEYCWTLYEGALKGKGDQIIGRQKDLGPQGANFYSSVGGLDVKATNFDTGTFANVQQMDKWAKVCNDAWILGGVHRRAIFRLASPLILDNLWNRNGYFVVTAREIVGLMHFGYVFEQIGPWLCMVPKKFVMSQVADLVIYDKLIKRRETVATAAALCDVPKTSLNGGVASQVNAFHRR